MLNKSDNNKIISRREYYRSRYNAIHFSGLEDVLPYIDKEDIDKIKYANIPGRRIDTCIAFDKGTSFEVSEALIKVMNKVQNILMQAQVD